MMHGAGKSDSAIVAAKPTNKAGQPAAEPVERRAGAEGNVRQRSTCRAQHRESVSQLERIRQVERQANGDVPRASAGWRQLPKVGAECPNWARSEFVRGAPSNGWPYRDLRCAGRILISFNTRQYLRFEHLAETVDVLLGNYFLRGEGLLVAPRFIVRRHGLRRRPKRVIPHLGVIWCGTLARRGADVGPGAEESVRGPARGATRSARGRSAAGCIPRRKCCGNNTSGDEPWQAAGKMFVLRRSFRLRSQPRAFGDTSGSG